MSIATRFSSTHSLPCRSRSPTRLPRAALLSVWTHLSLRAAPRRPSSSTAACSTTDSPPTRQFGISIHNSGALVEFFSQTVIPDQLFHHYAMTYDGSDVRLYFDGVHDTTVTVGSIQALVGGGDIALGNSARTGSPMDGLVDDVRVWNVARTATQ